MLIHVNWNDISIKYQEFIIYNMLVRFNKLNQNQNQNIINILDRFTKKKCIIEFYYEHLNNKKDIEMKGICILWKCNKFIYLDKFFTTVKNTIKGTGTLILSEFIDKYSNNTLMWRTDKKTSEFYLKNENVIKYFENNKYVYLGIRKTTNRFSWEYEDIYDLNVKSCFL
jgi:hypothetical protein